MPRTVRNFWIEGQIDGQVSKISGGPKSKNGGFVLTIFQRDKGEVKRAVRIEAMALSTGRLILNVQPDLNDVEVNQHLDNPAAGGGLIIETNR